MQQNLLVVPPLPKIVCIGMLRNKLVEFGGKIGNRFVHPWSSFTFGDTVMRVLLLAIGGLWFSIPAEAQLLTPHESRISTQLIAADLESANQTLAILDLNDDGALDQKEQAKLEWFAEAKEFDLDRNERLSQIEIAIYFAAQRDENDVEAIDITVTERAMKAHDANQNGQIDPDEISTAWPDDPHEIDVDQDGVLTFTELSRAFAFRRVIREELGILGVDQGWAIKIRTRFDRDRDGGLSEAEWQATPLPGDPAKFDENSDGRLSTLEMATMLAKHRQKLGLTGQDQLSIRPMFLTYDADFNGTISKQELERLTASGANVSELLDKWDINKDGEISLAEMEKELARLRDEKGYTDTHAQQASRLILRHDTNRDKHIGKNELNETESEGQLTKELFPQIDRNSDSVIDHEELARYLASQPTGGNKTKSFE